MFQVNLEEFCAKVVVDDLIQGALKEDAQTAQEDLFVDSEDGGLDKTGGRRMVGGRAKHMACFFGY